MKQFNIFDYLDVKGLEKDLELDMEKDWILNKIDDRGTFTIEEK